MIVGYRNFSWYNFRHHARTRRNWENWALDTWWTPGCHHSFYLFLSPMDQSLQRVSPWEHRQSILLVPETQVPETTWAHRHSIHICSMREWHIVAASDLVNGFLQAEFSENKKNIKIILFHLDLSSNLFY